MEGDATGSTYHVVIQWPATFAGYKMSLVDELISEQTDVIEAITLPSMHYRTLRRLVVEVYAGEPFIGSAEDGYKFSTDKSNWVWRESDRAQILLVRSSMDELLELKEWTRKLCGIGRHAVHTTDTRLEASRVWAAARRMSYDGFQGREIYLR